MLATVCRDDVAIALGTKWARGPAGGTENTERKRRFDKLPYLIPGEFSTKLKVRLPAGVWFGPLRSHDVGVRTTVIPLVEVTELGVAGAPEPNSGNTVLAGLGTQLMVLTGTALRVGSEELNELVRVSVASARVSPVADAISDGISTWLERCGGRPTSPHATRELERDEAESLARQGLLDVQNGVTPMMAATRIVAQVLGMYAQAGSAAPIKDASAANRFEAALKARHPDRVVDGEAAADIGNYFGAPSALEPASGESEHRGPRGWSASTLVAMAFEVGPADPGSVLDESRAPTSWHIWRDGFRGYVHRDSSPGVDVGS
jgi:hypothetical protein